MPHAGETRRAYVGRLRPAYLTFAMLSASTFSGTPLPYALPTPPPLCPVIAVRCSSGITSRAAPMKPCRKLCITFVLPVIPQMFRACLPHQHRREM